MTDDHHTRDTSHRLQIGPQPGSSRHRCNPHAVLADLALLIRQTLGKDVLLHLALAGDDAVVALDHASLEQMIMNLIMNARDAMPAGGTLTITTRCTPALGTGTAPTTGHLTLEVADTGSGMPPRVRERIFEPFFTTRSADKSSGVGLAIVADIVSRVDGRIDVESAVGRGTTVRICLPLVGTSDDER